MNIHIKKSINDRLKDDSPKVTKNTNKTETKTPVRNTSPQVGRNDPCPCGSNKKYKNCCGRNA